MMENTKRPVNRLRGAIYARYDSLTQFAKEIGWSRPRVLHAIRESKAISFNDASKISAVLELSPEEYAFIFAQ